MLPIFSAFPQLHKELPHLPLGRFPTPVQEIPELSRQLQVKKLYIKRDDLCGNLYGGNKVRKLEFLLAKALKDCRPGVLTFGCAGSNHALATAIYAKKHGLKRTALLLPQPKAYSVRRNLLLAHHFGAEMHYVQSEKQLRKQTEKIVQSFQHCYGKGPEIIPPGGSSPLGATGFVNAAFELQLQIRNHEIQEPDFIYTPSGTMGTAAGLVLGCRVCGLKSRILPVRVTDLRFSNTKRMSSLLNQTAELLHGLDKSFPGLTFSADDIVMEHDFFGAQYAEYTKESINAIHCLEKAAGIKLEGTYTGKAFAALLAHAKQGNLKNAVVLFWNTFNSWDFSTLIKNIHYQKLPVSLHSYFTHAVQPLDKSSF